MIRTVGLAALLLLAGAAAAQDDAALDVRLRQVVDRAGGAVTLREVARSIEGRSVSVLVAGAAARGETGRPGLLVIAGLDGRQHFAIDVALGLIDRVREQTPAALDDATLYVIPCLNPDAYARAAAGTQPVGFGGTLTPDDADHDGRRDEDGPRDLNGDGRITWMRVFDPPHGMRRTHLADPDEPRLSREAEAGRGERAAFAWLIEGTDSDGDGVFAEDGPGGVDLDRNFPYHWPEHQAGAGAYPLSEPETRGLVDWLLQRDDVAAALVLGSSDNLRDLPEAGKRDDTKEAPLGIETDDKPWYEEMQRRYEERVGKRSTSKAATDGACHAWLYAQFGVPAFVVDLSRDRHATSSAAGQDGAVGPPPAGEGKAAADADAAKTSAADAADRKQDPDPKDSKEKEGTRKRPALEKEELDWLKLYDTAGVGFVPYAPFDHPLLGRIEIGGVPVGFRLNPAAEELSGATGKHADFVADLLARLPRLDVGTPTVEAVGGGVWRLRIRVENRGFLPSISAIGERVRRLLPLTLRIEVAQDRLVSGERLQRAGAIGGSGDSRSLEWWILGDPGDVIEWTLRSSQLGERKLRTTLAAEDRR